MIEKDYDDYNFADVKALGQCPEPDAKMLARVRNQILVQSGKSRPKSSRIVARIAIAAVAIFAVVATLAFVVKVPDAQAKDVLTRAAKQAKDPDVGQNQYLKVTTRWLVSGGWDDGATVLAEETISIYKPKDPTKLWVMDRSARSLIKPLNDGGRKRWQEIVDKSKDSKGELIRAYHGKFYPPYDQPGTWQVPTEEFMAALPRDPDQLLKRIRDDATGHGHFLEEECFVIVADLLRSGLASADLRAALFTAISEVPGVYQVDKSPEVDGKRVIALAFSSLRSGTRQQMIFDAETYQWLGEQQIVDKPFQQVPIGTATTQTVVKMEVVDAAP